MLLTPSPYFSEHNMYEHYLAYWWGVVAFHVLTVSIFAIWLVTRRLDPIVRTALILEAGMILGTLIEFPAGTVIGGELAYGVCWLLWREEMWAGYTKPKKETEPEQE